MVGQWFARVLDFKAELLAAGSQVQWHPPHMETRFREWVEGLAWDWCLSRQRTFGVPFPVWTCDSCGALMLADEAELPVDPTITNPSRPCSACGGTAFTPETDVMDTWATSSLSPQIVGQRLRDPALYAKVFPFSLRPQAHEIIRTWAVYTIAKSWHHFRAVPWQNAGISGWGLMPASGDAAANATENGPRPKTHSKISKSKGGGPLAPQEILETFGADAVRYWTASTGFGRDSVIDVQKIEMGAKLVTKLWNVARFAERFLEGAPLPETLPALSPADRWILASAQRLVRRATAAFLAYDYTTAKHETDAFFWRDFTDNYLELAKLRLYAGDAGARFAVATVLLALLKLFAPFFPHITEELYQALFAASDGAESIHRAAWPQPDARFEDDAALALGETLVELATAVRRYKSERGLSLGAELAELAITAAASLAAQLRLAEDDLRSITRAKVVVVESGTAFSISIREV